MSTVISYIAFALMAAISAVALVFAPDMMAVGFTAMMAILLLLGSACGLGRIARYASAFKKAALRIENIREETLEARWNKIRKLSALFDVRKLDTLFGDYIGDGEEKIASGHAIPDIDEYINETEFSLRLWNVFSAKLPVLLTAIGIIGTLVRFMAPDSVIIAQKYSVWMQGDHLYLYSAAVGILLAMLFSTFYQVLWSKMVFRMNRFVCCFRNTLVPSEEEQRQTRLYMEIAEVKKLLSHVSRSKEMLLPTTGKDDELSMNESEQILMPQILQGLQNGEFTFYLQPRFDLKTRKIIGAEALVRWNHRQMGIVSPSVFMPVLESNGYVTKLDRYIWEQVCVIIRRWLDSGLRPMPISVNVSKTDILAADVVQFFHDMLRKYRIPPRAIEIDIDKNAYLRAKSAAIETEAALRQAGFRVVVDGFNGNFVSLNAAGELQADALKLDLRTLDLKQDTNLLKDIFEKADSMKMKLIAEGIETMEQVSLLKKIGCEEGQGYYYSRPLPVELVEKKLRQEE